MNLDELVTKDYLTAEFAKERAYTDTRFEAVNVRFAELNTKFTLLYWVNGLIILVTVVPALQRLLGS